MRQLTALICFIAVISVGTTTVLYNQRVVLSKRESCPQDWSLISKSAPEEKISFVIALKQRNLDVLEVRIFYNRLMIFTNIRELGLGYFLTNIRLENVYSSQ